MYETKSKLQRDFRAQITGKFIRKRVLRNFSENYMNRYLRADLNSKSCLFEVRGDL